MSHAVFIIIIFCYVEEALQMQGQCWSAAQVQQMEAALRDYSNLFNSLQSLSQVRHPIIVLQPPFGEEEEEG